MCDDSQSGNCLNCGKTSDEGFGISGGSRDLGSSMAPRQRHDSGLGSSDPEYPAAEAPPPVHVAKFLCPRFAKFADSPSVKDEDLFTGGDGQVEIESCGWEMQIFVDRKPEVTCTDRIDVKDFDDGTIRINDFVIEPNSDLGCGSFCSFKVASCTKDNGLYAIKTMSKKKAKKSSMLFKKSGNPFINIERETIILKKINHPNIVKLFEILDDPEEDLIYFVFEFMDRGCILTIPTEHPLREGLATRYFRDILCGVEYLHSKSIIHRDLKPENLLLNTFGRVKLIDFGLSFCYENGNDMTRLPYGTPSFTAPECVDEELEEGYSGRGMEMWALGVTLFALVFGQVPYYNENLYELYRIIREDPVILPGNNKCPHHVSLDMRSLIKRILEKDRKQRLTLRGILSDTVFANKNAPNFTPERCQTCKHYNPKSCLPVLTPS